MQFVLVMLRFPPGTDQKVLNQFCKKFYGQNTTSWNGRYRYRRVGLLDSIPHRRLGRGAVMVSKEHLPRIKQFLSKQGAVFSTRPVQATKEDLVAIRKNPKSVPQRA